MISTMKMAERLRMLPTSIVRKVRVQQVLPVVDRPLEITIVAVAVLVEAVGLAVLRVAADAASKTAV